MDQRLPNGFLREGGVGLLMRHDLLVEVAIIEEFHDDAAWGIRYQSELASMKECLYPTM